jgi:hypothetical protein
MFKKNIFPLLTIVHAVLNDVLKPWLSRQHYFLKLSRRSMQLPSQRPFLDLRSGALLRARPLLRSNPFLRSLPDRLSLPSYGWMLFLLSLPVRVPPLSVMVICSPFLPKIFSPPLLQLQYQLTGLPRAILKIARFVPTKISQAIELL